MSEEWIYINYEKKCKSCDYTGEMSMIMWDGCTKEGHLTGGIIEKCPKCGRDQRK